MIEMAKAIFIRISGIFWLFLFVISLVLFLRQPAEVRFLGAMLSALAPLGFFLYVHFRPQTQLDIEMTLTGAFCFAMNLIVVGDVFLNSKPENYLPVLTGFGLLLWLVYHFWVPRYNLTLDPGTIEELAAAHPTVDRKMAYVFLTGQKDEQCRAMIESYLSEIDSEQAKQVFFVLNSPISGGQSVLPQRQIILRNPSVPVRFCSKFPLSAPGLPGLIPGLLVLDEKKNALYQKVWSDVRKRQDIRFVFRMLE